MTYSKLMRLWPLTLETFESSEKSHRSGNPNRMSDTEGQFSKDLCRTVEANCYGWLVLLKYRGPRFCIGSVCDANDSTFVERAFQHYFAATASAVEKSECSDTPSDRIRRPLAISQNMDNYHIQ